MKMKHEFFKRLFQNYYFWVRVSGIFRDGVYTTSPQQLYFTTLLVPIARSQMEDFMRNPVDFVVKAIQEMHPEMRGFMHCDSFSLGWFFTDDMIEKHKVLFNETNYRVHLFNKKGVIVNEEGKPVQQDIPLKPITVVYRTFHNGVHLTSDAIGRYIKQYVQTTLEAYLKEDIVISIGEVQIWG